MTSDVTAARRSRDGGCAALLGVGTMTGRPDGGRSGRVASWRPRCSTARP